MPFKQTMPEKVGKINYIVGKICKAVRAGKKNNHYVNKSKRI